ncbi:TetR/AcrR family transcriptional regulator [Arthrobacter sp. TMS2-4]
MGKLWKDTVQEHRSSVREAVLDAVARLVGQGGVPAVSMTKVADVAGISRATLYKYFPDVEALLAAWHERQVNQHLVHLGQMRVHAERSGNPLQTLRSVLEAYAVMLQQVPMAEAPAFLHQGVHGAQTQEHLRDFLEALIRSAVKTCAQEAGGGVRSDIAPRELALFSLHAVNAAAALPSADAARSLVGVIVDGLVIRP